MILEALIAGPDVEIAGHRLLPDQIDASLPLPLLREHKGRQIGEVFQLLQISRGLVALIDTEHPCADYTHVSPSLRLLSTGRMKLIEVSLVRYAKSPNTMILSRRTADPMREYQRLRREGQDLLIQRVHLLQNLVRHLHATANQRRN